MYTHLLTEAATYNEQLVISQIVQGDINAFADFFNQYQPTIYTYVLRLSRRETLAQEIVQDTFLKVWLRRELLTGISNIRGWLFKVAGNITYDALRREAHANEKLDKFRKEQEQDKPEDIFTPTEEFLLQQQYRQLLENAMNTLPGRQQEAFKLVKIQGLSREEAARKMGVSPESIKTNVTIAMQKVRAHCVANMGKLGLLLFLWATR